MLTKRETPNKSASVTNMYTCNNFYTTQIGPKLAVKHQGVLPNLQPLATLILTMLFVHRIFVI